MKHISEIIDDVLTEWAYQVNDGMPDVNNPLHMAQLEHSLYDLEFPPQFIVEFMSNLREKDNGGLSDKEKEKAHKMGLVSLGYGNWGKEEGGETTHKNVDGKLVAVGDDDKDDTAGDPDDSWDDEEGRAKPKIVQPQGNPYSVGKDDDDSIELSDRQKNITDGLLDNNLDELKESHKELMAKREMGESGMGGAAASHGESVYADSVNTLDNYENLYTNDKDDIYKLEKNVNIFRQRQQTPITMGGHKGEPEFPKPNTEEVEIFETYGWDKKNPSDEAYEYFAKRELFAQKQLQNIIQVPDSVFYKKGRAGFNEDPEAYKAWMTVSFDGAMATREELKIDSNIDTSKDYIVVQSEDGPDSHDKAVEDTLRNKHEETGDKHYKRQLDLMEKLGYHDTYTVGQDSEGRLTIYHISNKKASNISDPHNNTTPAKRITVIKESGFGSTIAIKVGQILETGFNDVSDVKQATVRSVKDVVISGDLANVADLLDSKYMEDIDDDKKFTTWRQDSGYSYSTTEEKLNTMQKYINEKIVNKEKVPYKFGKLFAKIGEEGMKKKTQKANTNINFKDSGIVESIKIKETEKDMVKGTYKKIVDTMGKSDKDEGFPDKDGNNGPHIQGYITTVLDAMHANNYIDNYDGDCGIAMGARVARPSDIRESLGQLSGHAPEQEDKETDEDYEKRIEEFYEDPVNRVSLKEHMKKQCRIDAETQSVTTRKGKFKLFKDEWRSAGTSSQKVASYFGEDMQNLMKRKIDRRRQKQTSIGK
jgi:hypothetical protein